ncbi:MAG: type III pantothenate kinase [Gemmatimonadaceae bacterium]|nr:type III pantothenate kinase [Gemmatimonadaceae bacterium]
MLIVFDVGNTETTIGLFDGVALTNHWRIMTAVSRTADEFGLVLRGLLSAADVSIGRVTAAAIGSVVPPITDPLVRACQGIPARDTGGGGCEKRRCPFAWRSMSR